MTQGLIDWLFWFKRPFETVFQSISRRLTERRRKRREKIEESKNVQTTPTFTFCKHNRPLHYYHPNCRTRRHWKFTQGHRTTRPPPSYPRNLPVKLFQNLSTDLAEEAVKAVFYLYSWRPFWSIERNHFSNFGRGLAKKHFCEIIFKICSLVKEKSFKVFFIYSLGGHFVQQSRTVWSILVHIT